jgi:hypothetical protein
MKWRITPAICGLLLLLPTAASAQMTLRPSNRPVVSAENEPWYLRGEGITWDGAFYYPAGPAVFFNPYEMVRSGIYRGIPLYAKTTIEPYSVVFVPVARGLMQPYERRRDDRLAGTTGSSVPSFPVQRDMEVSADILAQAPGSPMLSDLYYELEPFDGRLPAEVAPASSLGRRPAAPAPLDALRTARRPQGLNAFYVDYDGVRWFKSGSARLVDTSLLTRAGNYHGFAVYTNDARSAGTIFVTVGETAESMVTPYTRRD